MVKKKRGIAFWNNIKFKYKLTIINENTLEEVVGLRVSKLNGISVLVVTLAVVFTIAAIIIIFTPLRNYLPGYMNSNVRNQIVESALRLDSLQEAADRQKMYIMNIQDILSGNVKADSVASIDSLTNMRADTLMERTKREEEFRQRYEETEKYNLTSLSSQPVTPGLVFYKPAQGLITKHFDEKDMHFGTDIAVNHSGSVQTVLDGVVIMAAYTAETGYVISVQHNQGIVSIYKHCGSLLSRVGDKVSSGEAIATIGGFGYSAKEPHLHFEMWVKGTAIDPEKYIVF
jgi:lipoprotein NlpD